MDESPRTATRGWLITLLGVALFAGGLVGLFLPVTLDSYDSAGIQVRCGNGYQAELLQAAVDDAQSASAGRPATDYVRQCTGALAHRRAVLFAVVAVGAVVLVTELVAWWRVGTALFAGNEHEWSEEPTQALHEAHVLDRRYHARWQPPSDTTL